MTSNQHHQVNYLPSGSASFHSSPSSNDATFDYSLTSSSAEKQTRRMVEAKTIKMGSASSGNNNNNNAIRTKRTRGPRSCLECRSSKQKCEQLNYAALIPSADPQPPHMSCRRCRVLGFPCIVPDQLPKSTRLRMERNQNQLNQNVPLTTTTTTTTTTMNMESPMSVHHTRRPTWPSSNPTMQMDQINQINQHSHRHTINTAPITAAQPQQQQSQQEEHRRAFSFSSSSQPSFPPLPAMFSPSESSASAEQNRTRFPSQGNSGRSSSSPQQPRLSSSTNNTFDPRVFDPIPMLKGEQAPNPVLSKTIIEPDEHSPISPASSGMEGINDSSWYYRARVACRPAQLLEHLISSNFSIPFPEDPRLSGMPGLEDLVKHLISNQTVLTKVARRMTHIQGAVPYIPNFQTLLEDVERTAFLIGVGVYLEGELLHDDLKVLRAHLAIGCTRFIERLSDNVYDIYAVVIVAIYCPLLVPCNSLIGVSAGNALIVAAIRASEQLGNANAPAQLASMVDLPSLDSHVVQNASMWIQLTLQKFTLEILDEPMPIKEASNNHPRVISMHQNKQTNHATRKDIETLERYCRKMIENEDSTTVSRTSARCATLVMLCFATRQAEVVIGLLQDFSQQFEDSVLRIYDSAPRMNALRRWTDQLIDSLGMQMASGRDELRSISNYLGEKGVVSANQLKYFELSLAALEFASLNRMKDKLYVIAKVFFGVPKTSQEFLFSLFSRPLLLKSYEHLGIVRTCVAKHVLSLFTSLALDLQPTRRGVGLNGGNGEPLFHWGALAHVFPLTRWCGLLICCTSVLVEEIAGRFIAQEAPWGASGESRLEIYYMLVKQTYNSLVLFEEDAKMRFKSSLDEKDNENVQMLRIVLDSLEKSLAAISAWRKKASGVGQYGAATFRKMQERIPANSIIRPLYYHQHMPPMDMMQNQQHQPVPLHDPSILIPNSMPIPTTSSSNSNSSQIISPTSEISGKQAMTHSTSAGTTTNDRTIQFGDALLHDILFTPIEQFFGTT